MGLFTKTVFMGDVDYEARTAVLYTTDERNKKFLVVTGVPGEAELNLRAYTWEIAIEYGRTQMHNRDANPPHPSLRTFPVEVELITTNKVLAYWICEHAKEWVQKIYGPVPKR